MRPTHRLFLAGGALAALALAAPGPASAVTPKNTFNILMNYELGMHCTGFEFAYCCVLPPYNSILAQVVKTQRTTQGQGAFARLLEGDPNVGKDVLLRESVLRDWDLASGQFQKYVLRYWHDAQPRNDGRGKPQSSTLISAVEGNSLFMWNTIHDAAAKNPDGSLRVTGDPGAPESYDGATDVVVGDGDYDDPSDSYANSWMNHLYIYVDPHTGVPSLEGAGATGVEAQKIRLGTDVVFAPDCGPAGHPMGPETQGGDPSNPRVPNDCGGLAKGNVLTFSGQHGTIVYTQMKVLEDLPITLTSPRIWEALGLPLTPFEDSINFFGDPGLVDEDSIRPYVAMKAQLHRYDPSVSTGIGAPVLAGGQPVIGFGTAPIDIPNCERCHSNPPTAPNSPQLGKDTQWGYVEQEYNFWKAYYSLEPDAGDSDWYARLKSAAISMLYDHDQQHGTSFADAYPAALDACVHPASCTPKSGTLGESLPPAKAAFPQNTRLGHESVICQKCHADNVIAVVKSATGEHGLIPAITEAVHHNHRNKTEDNGPIVFADALGRDGGCQGCHPAHRSDGNMQGYPITLDGQNFYAESDNRLANGGCFVGRDVHSNPMKDVDGAGTPEHLTAVGQWLKDEVSRNQAGLAGDPRDFRGIWCTNCHSQLSQEIWKAENVADLVHGKGVCSAGTQKGKACTADSDCGTGGACALNNVRALPTLSEVAAAVGVSEAQAIAWLDPKVNDPLGDFTHAIWQADPGICKFLTANGPAQDGKVATIEVALSGQTCSQTGATPVGPIDCSGEGGPVFSICGTTDGDGDFSVNVLDFCTTPDCVSAAQAKLTDLGDSVAVAVPFSAATDGRDHWLSAGEPHCADCHSAPYTEQSGNINAFAPFNYPRKASLMRYSRGHRDITCQGCHESIHGLYPVTPTIDTTSYAQAASINTDGSHGPINCGACHRTQDGRVTERLDDLTYDGQEIRRDFDRAVSWAHTFTDEQDPRGAVDAQGRPTPARDGYCENCHEDERDEVSVTEQQWLMHAMKGRASRNTMDQVEMLTTGGYVFGARPNENPRNTVCQGCHSDRWKKVSCTSTRWKQHLSEGRVSPVVWESVSRARTGTPSGMPVCGW